MKIKVLHFLLSVLPVFVSTARFNSFGIDILKFSTLQGFSVFIVHKTPDGYRMYCNGAILNNNWILSLAIAMKTVKELENPKGLYALIGNNKELEELSHIPITHVYLDNGTTVPEFKRLMLLKTGIAFGYSQRAADVFFNFDQHNREYTHCELINYSIVNNMLRKSYFKVKLLPGENCKIHDRDIKCVKVTQPCETQRCSPGKTLYHPCADNFNVGAIIMCDIDLVAMFLGDSGGKGCGGDIDYNIANTAAIMMGEAHLSRRWIDRTIRPPDDPNNDFNDDYILPSDDKSPKTTRAPKTTKILRTTDDDNSRTTAEQTTVEQTTVEQTTVEQTTVEQTTFEKSPEENATQVRTSTKPPPKTESTELTKSTGSTESNESTESKGTANENLTTKLTTNPTTNNQTLVKPSTLRPKSTSTDASWRIVPLINRTKCSSGYRHDQIFGFASLLFFVEVLFN